LNIEVDPFRGIAGAGKLFDGRHDLFATTALPVAIGLRVLLVAVGDSAEGAGG